MHTGTTTRCMNTEEEPIASGTTAAATAAHTRYLSSPGCGHFTRKNSKVRASGFLPKTKRMQHSCSHPNAICNHRFKKRIELRTQEEPLVAEHRGGTDYASGTTPAATAAHTRYLSSPLLRLPPQNKAMQHSCSHSTSGFLQQHRACNIHAAPVTTSLGHHFPSSPLPFVTTSLRSPHSLSHHFPCDVLLWCKVSHHPSSRSILFWCIVMYVKSHTTLHQGQFFSDVFVM